MKSDGLRACEKKVIVENMRRNSDDMLTGELYGEKVDARLIARRQRRELTMLCKPSLGNNAPNRNNLQWFVKLNQVR